MGNPSEEHNANLSHTIDKNKCYFIDQDYLILTSHGQISPELSTLLSKYHYKKLYTRALHSPNPEKASDIEKEDAPTTTTQPLRFIAHELQKMKECIQLFTGLVQNFSSILNEVKRELFIARNSLSEFTHRIIETAKHESNYILRLEHFTVSEENGYIAEQAVKTALLCATVAQRQKYPYYKFTELTTAGLLHNVGFIKMHPELYLSSTLPPEERRLVAVYPYLGSKLGQELGFSPAVCNTILQCRENVDGSGYPQGLKNAQILLSAKIVSVCSTYAALVSARPYKPHHLNGHSALQTIIHASGKKYDQSAIQMLLSAISLFPVGTFVEITNNYQGIVVEPHPSDIRTPLVRLISQNFSPLQEIKIVATHVESMAIVRSLSEDEKNRIAYLLLPEQEDKKL